jgi:hypothetical protein
VFVPWLGGWQAGGEGEQGQASAQVREEMHCWCLQRMWFESSRWVVAWFKEAQVEKSATFVDRETRKLHYSIWSFGLARQT